MTSFQLPSSIFPENAVKHAELIYQQRSAKTPRRWRRWLNRAFTGLVVVLALIQFTTLFLASLTQRDPTPIVRALGPLPQLLILFTLYYHLSLMFQTISLTANSIARENEAQTWEMLVLTGINARQIVRGKWWATVQRQFPRYLLLGLIRAGATSAVAVTIISNTYFVSNYYNERMQLPHPFSILVSVFLGALFTVANLGFSAACGVMGSVVSKRSSMAVLRGFADQIVISLVPTIVVIVIINHLYITSPEPSLRSIYSFIGIGTASLADNGFNLLSNPIYVNYQYYTGVSNSPIRPIEFDWMLSALLTLGWYVLIIWFALWRAEKRAVSALASPVGK